MLSFFDDETYGRRNRILAGVLAVILVGTPLVAWALGASMVFVYLSAAVAVVLVLAFLGLQLLSPGHAWKTGMPGFQALPPGFADRSVDEEQRERRKR